MSEPKAKSVLGLDLGTATCEVSVVSKTGLAKSVLFPDGLTMLRSVVYFQEGEPPIVGQEAENLVLLDPAQGVRHWKRYMGSNDVLYTTPSGKVYRAEDLAAIYIRHCKDAVETETGMDYRDAVITVPANYLDHQKEATIRAAKTAGFAAVTLIHEPTAAMFSRLANTERDDVPDGLRLVVDKGGGTLDISVCQKIGNAYEIKATNGVPELGGLDYTQAIVDHSTQEFQRVCGVELQPDSYRDELADLWRRAEEAKVRLNRTDKVSIPIVVGTHKHQVTITKDTMRQICQPLVDMMLKCIRTTLDEAQLKLEDILELIPIGGGSQLFLVQEELQRFFGRPLSNHSDPIHCVAHGAVIRGWEDRGEVQVDRATILPSRGYALRDVTAHAIGVKALDQSMVERFSPILKKGVRIPSVYQETFSLAEEGQTDALVEILQGAENMDLGACLKLGEFELNDLPPIHGKRHHIEIEMRIDENGMLTSSARCAESDKAADLNVQYKKSAA